MRYEQKEGDGALFRAEKETEQHPDYTGTITIGGQQYWLSAWVKSSKDGAKKYMSLAARPKKPPVKSLASEPSPAFEDDTSLPF
jgi:hypothetical protein